MTIIKKWENFGEGVSKKFEFNSYYAKYGLTRNIL